MSERNMNIAELESLLSADSSRAGSVLSGLWSSPRRDDVLEIVRLLLRYGADPNDRETPYHAPETYDNAVVELLVESGKLNADSITTMLHRKHDWHDYDGIAWLLAHGADPNRMSFWGRRALHQAIERNNRVAFLELLLDHGADPLLAAKNGQSAIVFAAWMSRSDVLELFRARGFAIELRGGDALLEACAYGREEEARALAAPGMIARLEAEDPGLLAEAAASGNVAALRVMLALGFAIDARTRHAGAPNDTALHAAIWRGRYEAATLLIERGAPLDALNARGETPHAYAARAVESSEWLDEGSRERVRALINRTR